MLLAFLLVYRLTALVTANPFHKYPFVFLLDVGNEELEKTNTEQIRISVPGGSLALRYPAVGDGDTIAHLRVSGIDFGTDLKANVLDGGPGYKYVVLIFMGNPGVAYDAVITVQTVPNDTNVDDNIQDSKTNTNVDSNNYQVAEDPNDSAEDMSDSSESQNKSAISELTQSSSKIYTYAQNNAVEIDDGDGEDESKSLTDEKDIQNQYSEDYDQSDGNQDADSQDYVEEGDNEISNNAGELDAYDSQSIPKAEKYSISDGYVSEEDYQMEEPTGVVDSNLYGKYAALKPHFYDNVQVHPQEVEQDEQDNVQSDESLEDTEEIDQMFNDEEIHNEVEKNKDSNNNYFDSDDNSAVAY